MKTATIRIRMYNTGFGDCFLLTFPGPDRDRKILIDCGKHMLSKSGPKLSRIVQEVLKDIQEPGGPRVDVVIASHRHQDHVSGFAAAGWDQVAVGEVWMPWTEDPDDPVARDICERQSTKASRLQAGLTAMGFAAAEEREYMLGYAGNNLNNTEAMNLLHGGFQGRPRHRFLPRPAPEKPRFSPESIPGLEVFVLGPSRDPDVMSQMDPPGSESFFRAWEMSVQEAQPLHPFPEQFRIDRAAFETRFRRPDGWPLDKYFSTASESTMEKIFDDPAFEVASKLEEAVNSTSLVLLFHFGSAWLLFPGDAQWGTWQAILNNAAMVPLLKNLTFYKVGHHGSHNANPRSFVEQFVSKEVRAMIPYGEVKKWPEIPRPGLLTYFKDNKVQYARADVVPGPKTGFRALQEKGEVIYIDEEIPTSAAQVKETEAMKLPKRESKPRRRPRVGL